MKALPECYTCIINQVPETIRLITEDEEIIIKIMRIVFYELSKINEILTPPEIAGIVHRIIRKELHGQDPYLCLKEKSIKTAKRLAKKAEDSILASKDPFYTAIAFAIAGNILDFARNTQWNEDTITQVFSRTLDKAESLDKELLAKLYSKIKKADNILILGDNAGETVFDKIMMKYLPGKGKISYAVKSFPVINDATIKDAIDSNIQKYAYILPNGTDIPGTVIDECSIEFRELFWSADIIISKGQGNFETLYDKVPRENLWFLFQVKCPIIADYNRMDLGDWMIIENKKKYV